MVRNNVNVSTSDLDAIVRRLDINKDRRITVRELRTLCNNSASVSSSVSSTAYSRAMSSPRKRKVEVPSYTSSQFRPTTHYSPTRKAEQDRYLYPTSNIYHSPKRERDVVTTHLSPSRYKERDMVTTYLSPSRYNKPSLEILGVRNSPYKTSSERMHDNYEEHNFQAFLKDVVMWENEVERLKCDLALRSDFNLPDAYRVFEVDKRGYFNDLDFKYGANFLDVFPTTDEVALTFKRYTNGGEVLFT